MTFFNASSLLLTILFTACSMGLTVAIWGLVKPEDFPSLRGDK